MTLPRKTKLLNRGNICWNDCFRACALIQEGVVEDLVNY